jgi:anaerobic selenocysteine-containing dehydrogenase
MEATTCQGCTSWCAVQVYVENGRAIKVRGNPHSKVNGANACVRCHLSPQQVYDPDRIKTPMKRTNPKKGRDIDPGFVPITWDEALGHIADKILELRKNNETHKYVLWRGRSSYLRDIIYKNMTQIIGSPNGISHSAICAEAEKFGPYFTEGEWSYRQYDVLNTKYLLLGRGSDRRQSAGLVLLRRLGRRPRSGHRGGHRPAPVGDRVEGG